MFKFIVAGKHSMNRLVTICILTYKKKKYYGVAICSPEDKYDSMLGKRLALSRAFREAKITGAEKKLLYKKFNGNY